MLNTTLHSNISYHISIQFLTMKYKFNYDSLDHLKKHVSFFFDWRNCNVSFSSFFLLLWKIQYNTLMYIIMYESEIIKNHRQHHKQLKKRYNCHRPPHHHRNLSYHHHPHHNHHTCKERLYRRHTWCVFIFITSPTIN